MGEYSILEHPLAQVLERLSDPEMAVDHEFGLRDHYPALHEMTNFVEAYYGLRGADPEKAHLVACGMLIAFLVLKEAGEQELFDSSDLPHDIPPVEE
jgi:hypothetical protein